MGLLQPNANWNIVSIALIIDRNGTVQTDKILMSTILQYYTPPLLTYIVRVCVYVCVCVCVCLCARVRVLVCRIRKRGNA